MMRRLLTSFVILMIAVLAWRFVNPTAKAAKASIAELQRRHGTPVEIARPLRLDLEDAVPFEGTVEASLDLDCVFEVEGRVVELRAEVGRLVEKGTLLARLDDEGARHRLARAEASRKAAEAAWEKIEAGARSQEKTAAEARLNEAEAALKLAGQERERVRALAARKAATAQQLDGVEAQWRMAEARIVQARQALSLIREGARAEDRTAVMAQLEAARAAEALARLDLSHCELRAPFRGVVAERHVEVGDYVVKMPSPTPIVRLVNLDEVDLVGRISELDLPRIALGQTVSVSVDALGIAVEGRLSEIEPVGHAAQRAFRVEVSVANGDHRLKPGMFGRARIVLKRVAKAVAVDRRWLAAQKEGEAAVWLVDGDRARLRSLKIGIRQGTRFEVLEGLSGDESVVVVGGRGLAEGDRLRVVEREG